ncbi:MAG: FKBP-type peptidyl-prolyl cis-trans isomerase [Bacteroidota bacterium]
MKQHYAIDEYGICRRSLRLMHKFLLLSVCLFSLCACDSSSSTSRVVVETETDSSPRITEDELITRLSVDLVAEPSTQAERERNAIINYAIDNLLDVQQSATGLYYEIIKNGQGEQLNWGDYIEAHYKGYFMNGTIFDSTYPRKQAMQFYIGNMIDGWNEALQNIAPGGHIRLLIPSALAYGEKGVILSKGDTLVPPNSILLFDIEVLKKLR